MPLNQKINIIWKDFNVIILVTIVLKVLHNLEITSFTDFSGIVYRISYSNNLGFISNNAKWIQVSEKQIKIFDYMIT